MLELFDIGWLGQVGCQCEQVLVLDPSAVCALACRVQGLVTNRAEKPLVLLPVTWDPL